MSKMEQDVGEEVITDERIIGLLNRINNIDEEEFMVGGHKVRYSVASGIVVEAPDNSDSYSVTIKNGKVEGQGNIDLLSKGKVDNVPGSKSILEILEEKFSAQAQKSAEDVANPAELQAKTQHKSKFGSYRFAMTATLVALAAAAFHYAPQIQGFVDQLMGQNQDGNQQHSL